MIYIYVSFEHIFWESRFFLLHIHTVLFPYHIHIIYNYIYTKWDPQTIAKLVNITPITMVYGTYNLHIYI